MKSIWRGNPLRVSPFQRAPGRPGRTLLEGNPGNGFPSNGRFAPCLLSKEHFAMNSRRDIEICARNEARAGCPTPPCDQGGGSPLDPSTSGSPWQTTGHINRSSNLFGPRPGRMLFLSVGTPILLTSSAKYPRKISGRPDLRTGRARRSPFSAGTRFCLSWRCRSASERTCPWEAD